MFWGFFWVFLTLHWWLCGLKHLSGLNVLYDSQVICSNPGCVKLRGSSVHRTWSKDNNPVGDLFSFMDLCSILILPSLLYLYYLINFLQGHDVTVVAGDQMPIMSQFKSPDIKWITYKMPERPVTETPDQFVSSSEVELSFEALRKIAEALKRVAEECKNLFRDESAITQIQNKNFDFVIIDSTAPPLLILPYRFGIPYASFQLDFYPLHMRIPVFPSYVPQMLTGFTDCMTFKQKLINFLVAYAFPVLYLLVEDTGLKDTAQFSPLCPATDYYYLQQNASLFFTLRAPGLHFVRGSLPNMVDMGGIMGQPANTSNIPSALKTIVDNNEFIMVSFGSWMDQPKENCAEIHTSIWIKQSDCSLEIKRKRNTNWTTK